jgi:hypothetical protein
MKHFVILEDSRYEGRQWGTPEGVEGADWIKVNVAPENVRDTWDSINEAWLPYQEPVTDYPTEVVMKDIATGHPMKVVIKNGEVFTSGIDEEIF